MVQASALSLLLFGTHSRKAPPRRCQVVLRQNEAIVRPQATDVPVYDYRLRGRELNATGHWAARGRQRAPKWMRLPRSR